MKNIMNQKNQKKSKKEKNIIKIKKISKPLEEEEIKYDTIFDEFTYIANAINKNVLSFLEIF